MPAIPPLFSAVDADRIRTFQAESEYAASVEFAAAAEITFVLVMAGLMCLALQLAGHATPWSLPVGVLLLGVGVALLVVLPLHPGGAMMLAFAAGSLAFEALAPGFGVHALSAGVSTLFAGLYLTGAPPGVHPGLVVPVAAVVGVGAFVAGRRSWRFRRDRPFDGSGELVGRGAVVLSVDGSAEDGMVAYGVVSGQLWRLRTRHGVLQEGSAARVVEVSEDWLLVRPVRSLLTT